MDNVIKGKNPNESNHVLIKGKYEPSSITRFEKEALWIGNKRLLDGIYWINGITPTIEKDIIKVINCFCFSSKFFSWKYNDLIRKYDIIYIIAQMKTWCWTAGSIPKIIPKKINSLYSISCFDNTNNKDKIKQSDIWEGLNPNI